VQRFQSQIPLPDKLATRVANCQHDSGRTVTYSEIILGRDLLSGELDFCWDILASLVKHRVADWPRPVKSGGLNGSMQHLLEVFVVGVYEADFVREG
jgi:hypothetical protein